MRLGVAAGGQEPAGPLISPGSRARPATPRLRSRRGSAGRDRDASRSPTRIMARGARYDAVDRRRFAHPGARGTRTMSRTRLLAVVAVPVLVATFDAPARAADLSQAALFAYNPAADLRLRTVGVETRGSATVVDLLFDDSWARTSRRTWWCRKGRARSRASSGCTGSVSRRRRTARSTWRRPSTSRQGHRLAARRRDVVGSGLVRKARARGGLRQLHQAGHRPAPGDGPARVAADVDKARLGFVGHDYGGMYGDDRGPGPAREDVRVHRGARPQRLGVLRPPAPLEDGLPPAERAPRAHRLPAAGQEREHAVPVRNRTGTCPAPTPRW